jgi:hypothetical protein
MMMNRISVMATAVGFSVASLSAHGAANELLCVDDASPARMAITESIDRLSSSFSDPITRGAVTFEAPAQAAEGAGQRRLTIKRTGTRTVTRTVTRNPKSAETFALADPKGGMLRLDTRELVTPVNRYVGINHVGINHVGINHVGINYVAGNHVAGNHVESGATGGSTSKHIVNAGVPRRTTGSPVNAPEIDPASAAGGLMLLAGGIVVLLGRRRVLTPC